MEDFICPITGKYFSDPVLAEDGYFYEFYAIYELIRLQSVRLTLSFQEPVMGIKSPSTGDLIETTLMRSFQFTKELNQFLKDNNLPYYDLKSYKFGLVSLNNKDEEIFDWLLDEKPNEAIELFFIMNKSTQNQILQKYNLEKEEFKNLLNDIIRTKLEKFLKY